EQVILEFGLRKPAFRIVVNTPTTLGSIGMTTGLAPSMTLGCGGYGGNITSDNITPQHLLNIKRLAYEVRSVSRTTELAPTAPAVPSLPEAPEKPASGGLDRGLLARRIETFLATRGIASAPPAEHDGRPHGQPNDTASIQPLQTPSVTPPPQAPAPVEHPVEFVCEDDVRQAVRANQRIVVNDRTIITPAARDLGVQHRVFIEAELPR
ncbi:MAG: hypothetical protein QF786_14075, partial [Vicinamibacterales bacterium]|nr:hypothetical protein [Vicinamibacterales bacterium]